MPDVIFPFIEINQQIIRILNFVCFDYFECEMHFKMVWWTNFVGLHYVRYAIWYRLQLCTKINRLHTTLHTSIHKLNWIFCVYIFCIFRIKLIEDNYLRSDLLRTFGFLAKGCCTYSNLYIWTVSHHIQHYSIGVFKISHRKIHWIF